MVSMKPLVILLLIPVLFGVALIPAHQAQDTPVDPTKGEVPLPCAEGWNAFLLHDAGVGVWTVRSFQVFPQYGCPEVVGLDDRGRCTILISYSGKWTPVETIHDGQWLGAVVHLDLDGRLAGRELYTGGKRGRLYQIHPRPEGGIDTRIVAVFKGEEIHTMVSGSLGSGGSDLLIFTRAGKVYQVRPGKTAGAPFKVRVMARLHGRVRSAVVIPSEGGGTPCIATVARAQEVALLRMEGNELRRKVILREPMGFGRIALRKPEQGKRPVLYVTRDDGVLVRLEQSAGEAWTREVIYAGPQGLRGVVAGRFHEQSEVETVAVFGYSRKVQLLTREPGKGWSAKTLFTAADKGHSLTVAELDGRNATDEILGSGYGCRVFMLARPPGFGLDGVATDPDEKPDVPAGAEEREEAGALRMAVFGPPVNPKHLTPLKYGGGFETKTLLFETLVKRDVVGNLVPGLASSWKLLDGGKAMVFTLREGAMFHDGSPVDAAAVQVHFKRWVNMPEHGWLRASLHIREVTVPEPGQIRIDLDQPYALLPDLCAMNPTGILGPGSANRHGFFEKPVGTGPFRFLGVLGEGRVLRYARFCPGMEKARVGDLLNLVFFPELEERNAVAALVRGEIDVLVDTWSTHVPRQSIAALKANPEVTVTEVPGSTVMHLNFNLKKGPASDARLRHKIRASIDREALIQDVEMGHADPCFSWSAPTVKIWPRSRVGPVNIKDCPPLENPLRLLVAGEDLRQLELVPHLVRQLVCAGLAVKVEEKRGVAYTRALKAGEYDLSLDRTWGLPYDPYITLVARFLPPRAPSAGSHKFTGIHRGLARYVEEATRLPKLVDRMKVYRKIQDLMDGEALLVPLYVPRRVTVVRAGLKTPGIDNDIYRLDLSGLMPGE